MVAEAHLRCDRTPYSFKVVDSQLAPNISWDNELSRLDYDENRLYGSLTY